MLRRCLTLLLALFLCGCVTSRTWDMPTEEVLQHKIKAGDDVTIVADTGKTYRFEVTSVAEDALHGQNRGKRYKVAFASIDSIHVRRAHAGQTAGLLLGGAALIGAGIVVENLGDQNWDLCGGN